MKLKYFIIPVVLLVLGAGCEQTKPVAEKTQAEVQQPAAQGVYENKELGFSLTFPSNWGAVLTKVEDGHKDSKFYKMVTFTVLNDDQRYFVLNVVKTENKDAWTVTDFPHSLLTGNSVYQYYYTGSFCPPTEENEKCLAVEKEIKAISKSFKLK